MFTSLPICIALFIIAAAVIGFVGTRMTVIADRLADRTGLGEAFVGAVLLGAVTSLGGIAATVTAAIDGRPVLAMANAVGGIAAQTAFLVIGDIAYRKANLEHAAASVENMMQGALLIILLAILMVAMIGPRIEIGHVNVMTPVMIAAYIAGLRVVQAARRDQMWRPRDTTDTRTDQPDEPVAGGPVLRGLWLRFVVTAAIVTAAGWLLTRAAETIASQTGVSDSMMGAVAMGIATSLPELVTCIAAVRRGALTLAVGGIIGGNAFDTLVACIADVAYLPGSIYHAATAHELWIVALTTLMTATLLLGLLRREKAGFANIGFESAAVLVIYLVGMAMLALM